MLIHSVRFVRLAEIVFVGYVQEGNWALRDKLHITELAADSATWDARHNRYNLTEGFGFSSGTLPAVIKTRLSTTWQQSCNDESLGKSLVGVALRVEMPCPPRKLRFNEIDSTWAYAGIYQTLTESRETCIIGLFLRIQQRTRTRAERYFHKLKSLM